MGEWREATIQDLQHAAILLVEDGNHGEYRPRSDEFAAKGTAFVRAADMDSGRVRFSSASRINEVALARIRKGIGRPNDVLLSHKGTVGKVAWVGNSAPDFVCSPQTTFYRSLNARELHPRFLFFYLQSPHFQGQLQSRQGETDMAPYVSLTEQRRLVIPLPPLSEQRAIAEVLGALDDKIEANRRLVEHLQHFGRLCYLEAVESEVEVTEIDSIAAFHNRSRVPLSSRERSSRQGPYPYYGAAGPIDVIDNFLFDGVYVLVGEDGTVLVDGCRPMVQYVWGRFWVSNHAHVLTGKGLSTELLRTVLSLSDITAAVTGAVQPKLSMGNLKKVQVLLPRNRDRLDEQLSKLASLERAVAVESWWLVELRDALLPKLLSGEVRVRDAEELVGEAV